MQASVSYFPGKGFGVIIASYFCNYNKDVELGNFDSHLDPRVQVRHEVFHIVAVAIRMRIFKGTPEMYEPIVEIIANSLERIRDDQSTIAFRVSKDDFNHFAYRVVSAAGDLAMSLFAEYIKNYLEDNFFDIIEHVTEQLLEAVESKTPKAIIFEITVPKVKGESFEAWYNTVRPIFHEKAKSKFEEIVWRSMCEHYDVEELASYFINLNYSSDAIPKLLVVDQTSATWARETGNPEMAVFEERF